MEETDKPEKSQLSTEYFGVFPTVLFLCPDYTPMHFVISLKDTPEECISKIVGLMEHCGADVTLNVNEAADYSIVISDHSDGLDFYGPVFDLEFIKECLNQLKVLDISKYRLRGSMLPKGANCMDVVYYKRLGWKAFIQQQNQSSSSLNLEHMDISVSISEDDYSKEESMKEPTNNYENVNKLDDNERDITKNGGKNTSKEKSRKVLSQHKRSENAINDEENLYSDESLLESCSPKYKKSQAVSSTSKTADDKWQVEFENDDDDNKQTNINNSNKRDISDEEDGISLSGTANLSKKRHKQCFEISTALSSDRENNCGCNNLEGESNENEENVEQFVAHVGEIINRRDFSEEIETRKKKKKENNLSSEETIYSDESLFESCPSRTKTVAARVNCSETSNKWRFLNEFCSDSDDDDNHQSDINSSVKRSNEKEQVEADATGNTNCTQNTTTKPSEVVPDSSTKSKRRFLNEFYSDSDDDDNHQSDINNSVKRSNEEEQVEADATGNTNCTQNNKTNTTTKPSEVVPDSSTKRFFDFGFGSDDSDAKPAEVNRSTKRSRQPYTHEERVKILEYITVHNEYSRIKGRELWIIMERRKVCPTRTWQSMKEHFLKKVLHSLDEFTFLTNTQKHKIRNVCF